MKRNQPADDPTPVSRKRTSAGPAAGSRLLLACGAPDQRKAWSNRIAHVGFVPHAPPTCKDAQRLLRAAEFDAVLIDSSAGATQWERLRSLLARHAPAAQIIEVVNAGDLSAAIEALRRGASDVFTADISDAVLRERLIRAADRAAAEREQARSTDRLRSLCRKLTDAVQNAEERIDSLSREVSNLAVDAQAQMAEAAMVAEFRAILSLELDLESLLRTSLQYLLKKTGPTNAAIFLPDARGDYSLGAYVNYDCPREAADLLLEHICSSICPHLRNEEAIVRFEDGDELAQFLGEQAAIINGRDVIAFRCAHKKRTFAIMMLFRDRDDAFDSDLPATLDALRPILAAQLQAVLRVHHRARPQWPREAAEDVTDGDDDFGFGIAA
jgi:FixJ family two-component response regulator